MLRHYRYALYLLRHKWFVLVACWRIGAPLWLGIIHDLSKFRPSEWFPYASTFYTPNGAKWYKETDGFKYAWNYHQKRNRHHWQCWLITWDRGGIEALRMPRRYVLEMVADWMGAGRAISGRWEAAEWYGKNRHKIILHPVTRVQVESLLQYRV